jgi:hypothetical protein
MNTLMRQLTEERNNCAKPGDGLAMEAETEGTDARFQQHERRRVSPAAGKERAALCKVNCMVGIQP